MIYKQVIFNDVKCMMNICLQGCKIELIMPKLIDNYVLTRKIGAGQYGEVFRGYDRATNMDVAVKSIRRDSVKGKFKELLESEIRVLKACESPNIIKLYDMKKTSHNFYLVMQYCNDGDLDAYVKRRKYLTEDEAVSIFCEVVNGFRHLYKHSVLHRDLKLANILRHDGVAKIADFGFSKITGEEGMAQTMLGSPLNMAPQIFQNKQYSNKADMYSLGVCFYWMLFGRPPYQVKSLPELKAALLRQSYEFPRAINPISDLVKDLIRSMLRPDPKQRLSWEQLFAHPIHTHLAKQIQRQIAVTLTMDGSLAENVCKLYLNQYLVIIHPSQFRQKEEGVDFVVGLVKNGKKEQFQGVGFRQQSKEIGPNTQLQREQLQDDDKLCDHVPEDQKMAEAIQSNAFGLLNERNKIMFVLSVMSEIRNRRRGNELLGELIRTVRDWQSRLEVCISSKNNQYNMPYWKVFISSPTFSNLQHFLMKEKTIVNCEIETSSKKACAPRGSLSQMVISYCEETIVGIKNQLDEKSRADWIHLCHLCDVTCIEVLMTKDFDFKHYYCEYGKYQMPQLVDLARSRIKKINK